MRGTVSGIRSLYGLFKVLKCYHQHGHFCHFVYIEYYSAGDIFTKFEKFYPLARFASSRCSELSAAFGDLRACYRGRVRITVALASAVIHHLPLGEEMVYIALKKFEVTPYFGLWPKCCKQKLLRVINQ